MPIPARPPSALLMNLNSVGLRGKDAFLCRSSRNAAPFDRGSAASGRTVLTDAAGRVQRSIA